MSELVFSEARVDARTPVRSTRSSGIWSRPTSATLIATPPDLRHVPRASTTTTASSTTHPATRVEQEIADAHKHLADDRGARPGRPVGERPLRARAGDPQHPPRAVRRGGPSRLGAPLHRHGRRRRRALQHLRPRLRAAAPSASTSITERLEAIPAYLEQHKTRATAPQVKLWQELEIDAGEQMPFLFDEIKTAGVGVLDERAQAAPRQGRGDGLGGRPPPTSSTSRPAWARPWRAGRSARTTTTSSSACAPSTASTRARSSRSATSSWPSTRPPGSRTPAASTRTRPKPSRRGPRQVEPSRDVRRGARRATRTR